MKGVVFTEFVEMVEETFSMDVADQIVEKSDLPSGGVYTSLGTYDHGELLQMVTHLSAATDSPIPDLVTAFGQHLAVRFAKGYPQFFEAEDLFSFLESVEGHIHVEVLKLYPDAELPSFETERIGDDKLIMRYSSSRPFSTLAHGLIGGTIEKFGEDVDLEFEDTSNGQGNSATFTLTRK